MHGCHGEAGAHVVGMKARFQTLCLALAALGLAACSSATVQQYPTNARDQQERQTGQPSPDSVQRTQPPPETTGPLPADELSGEQVEPL